MGCNGDRAANGAWLTPGTGGHTLVVLKKARDLFKQPWPIMATFGFLPVRDQRSPGVLESRERTCLQCRRHRFNLGGQENPCRREWQSIPVLPQDFHGWRPAENWTQLSDFHFSLKIQQRMVTVLDSVTVCRKMSVCNAGHGKGWDGTSV